MAAGDNSGRSRPAGAALSSSPSRRDLLTLSSRVVTLLALAAPASLKAGTSGMVWPGGHRAAVSLTYDDGLDSQLDQAVPMLEAEGMRGTFFVTETNMATQAARWKALAARGHELANHTVSHPCDLARVKPTAFSRREIGAMDRYLDGLEGRARPRLFAYPCDVTDLGRGSANRQALRYARLLDRQGIVAARTSEGGPNNPDRIARERYRLRALAVGYDTASLGAVTAYLDTAVRRGHWAILVFHDIVRQPGDAGQVSAADHATILEAIRSRDIWCAPMGQVLSYIEREQGGRGWR